MIIIAIDPGMSGGIAISGNPVTAQIMPVAGKELDLAALTQLIKVTAPTLAVIEKVHSMPGQGVASMFKFGQSYGALLGVLSGLAIPVELVTPQAWKKKVLAGSAKDKDAAIAYCRRVYPQVSLIPPRCRTPHDGIADALCLLSYGLQTFAGYQEVAA